MYVQCFEPTYEVFSLKEVVRTGTNKLIGCCVEILYKLKKMGLWLCNSSSVLLSCLEALCVVLCSLKFLTCTNIIMGHVSVVGIATRYGRDVLRIESRWGRDFPNRPFLSWGSPSFLCNGYRLSFSGLRWPGRGDGHPYPFRAEGWRKSRGVPIPPPAPSYTFFWVNCTFFLVEFSFLV